MQHSEIVKLIQGELSARLAGLTIIPRHRAPSAQAGKATVLIGMRRVGKTFCLFRHIKALESQGIPRDSILFLNLEDDRLR